MDYALIWSFLIALAVMLYVLLDGFDLGVGMLFALARTDADRNLISASVEPVWDGNETWLVLGGGGLLAAFPLAYSILMPAFYMPVTLMLVALIFRGVAFEFRHKAARPATRKFWNGAFVGGSFTAALMQGVILGSFVQGVNVDGRHFAGGAFDWLTPFSLLVGVSVVAGYILLGACWLVLKTDGELLARARIWARNAVIAVAIAMVAVSLATLSVDPRVTERWGVSMQTIDFAKFTRLFPIPAAAGALVYLLWRDVRGKAGAAPDWRPPDWRPYVYAAGLFVTGYLGLAASLFPYNVPFAKTIWETAAYDNALALLLVGASVMLPVILGYTIYVYSLFWGKVREGDGYHD